VEDDLMPNSGDYFSIREPEEQVLERKAERAKLLADLPLVKKAITHFEKRISDRDSIESIKVDLQTSPEMYQKVCETNRLVKQALIEEKELLEELVNTYKPR
jgi:hypothetical protein